MTPPTRLGRPKRHRTEHARTDEHAVRLREQRTATLPAQV
ncbi:hypothetical protein J2Z21_001693 [Streptomyces griseochromogenes]|uniref:Uncharacterized protein n=1 Tax=Streptomyces griseochromogenes TaxID=68214 RepID=A0ABS4LMZ8_9ACTN|nr:hypothetical protein [Streptomyces griseochromogenes]